MGCSALPASFWHQAEGLQSLPWSKHREREVAGFFKDEKGKKERESSAFGRFVLLKIIEIQTVVTVLDLHYLSLGPFLSIILPLK